MHFQSNICVLNVSTKFGEDWSNSTEMATVFRNYIFQDGGGRHLELLILRFFDNIDVF